MRRRSIQLPSASSVAMQSSNSASSYFAARTIAIGPDEQGLLRLLLNGKPLFQVGPLDQGWWPDGLLTPPSEDAMRYDLMS